MDELRHLGAAASQVDARALLLERAAKAVATTQDVGQHRPRDRPDVDVRIQRAADAFDVQQRLLQQDQLRLQVSS
jgi:hypothetical protein